MWITAHIQNAEPFARASNPFHIGEVKLRHMMDEVPCVRFFIEEFQPLEMLLLEIPVDDLEIFLQLLECKIFLAMYGLNCRVLVGNALRHAADEPFVNELQLLRPLLRERAVRHPKRINHTESRKLVPLSAKVIVVEILAAMVIKPERVIADEERA